MARRRKQPEPTDSELHALAAGAMLLYAAALPKSTLHQRITWESNKMHLFMHQLGASRRTACIVNELLYWHRFKGLTIPESLKAARRELNKR